MTERNDENGENGGRGKTEAAPKRPARRSAYKLRAELAKPKRPARAQTGEEPRADARSEVAEDEAELIDLDERRRGEPRWFGILDSPALDSVRRAFLKVFAGSEEVEVPLSRNVDPNLDLDGVRQQVRGMVNSLLESVTKAVTPEEPGAVERPGDVRESATEAAREGHETEAERKGESVNVNVKLDALGLIRGALGELVKVAAVQQAGGEEAAKAEEDEPDEPD